MPSSPSGPDLAQALEAFRAAGARSIYAKLLAPNDNSKNQPYFGGDFGVLNILPVGELTPRTTGSHGTPIFEAQLRFEWLGGDGEFHPAPNAKLILYPQYPEVRFSGYLRGCDHPPSGVMGNTREPGRVLVLGVCDDGRILGVASAADTALTREFHHLRNSRSLEQFGVFEQVPISDLAAPGNLTLLVSELQRICDLGWINSRRLLPDGSHVACRAPNCGGYTLEAELGITPNGYAEPDFMGWEVKQYAVRDFQNYRGGPVTLMTPEPTHGYYKDAGVVEFLRRYGYEDLRGRHDRRNFGGVHRANELCARTGLTLRLVGYDAEKGKMVDPSGGLMLIDSKDRPAAVWPYAGLIKHWNRKHARAVYVPSQSRNVPHKQYRFGKRVRAGVGTDFLKFLSAMNAGEIYYDPGIKAESWSSSPRIKRRSQFRIASAKISMLYGSMIPIDIT